MTFLERLQTLDRLHNLIRLKATGSPQQLAQRLQVSKRTIFNLLEDLRTFGADIAYCKYTRSYYYAEPIQLCFDPLGSASKPFNSMNC
ncbi:MAG: HTH domain-containing protein [Cyanothece sp. SIO1E1]|nr:HTH domain-containing protein [Cyanothece sp. SIO1E1]